MTLFALAAMVSSAALAVAALYLRRPRPRAVVVPFLGWFVGARGVGAESRAALLLREPLSLLLQLTLLGLLGYLGTAFVPHDAPVVEKVVLVDATVPLDALDRRGGSVGQRLEDRLGDLLARFSTDDRVTIVSFGETPRVLARGRAGDRSLLDFEWPEGGMTRAPNVEDALALAKATAGDGAEVVLLGSGASSGALEALRVRGVREFPSGIELRVGKEPRVVAFGARRVPSDPTVIDALLVVDGEGREERTIEIEIAAARSPRDVPRVLFFDRRRVRFPEEIEISGLVTPETALVATVRESGSTVPFEREQRGFAAVVELPPVRVFVRGEVSTFLAAALLQDPRFVRVEERALADVEVVTREGSEFATTEARLPALYLGVFGPVRPVAKLADFGFDSWDAEHPLFASLDPYEVQVLRGAALSPEKEDRVLARSGSRAIVVHGRRSEREFLSLGFVPEESDFVLRPAYPLFIHNALLLLAGRTLGGPSPTALVGESLEVDLTGGAGDVVRVFGPWPGPRAEDRTRAAGGPKFVFVPEREGFYSITWGTASKLVAVARRNESRPEPSADPGLPTFDRPPASLAPPWIYFAGSLLVLGSAVEWLGQRRRWTS